MSRLTLGAGQQLRSELAPRQDPPPAPSAWGETKGLCGRSCLLAGASSRHQLGSFGGMILWPSEATGWGCGDRDPQTTRVSPSP